MVDLDEARARMVQEQIEARGINDARVIAAMSAVERHRFIPPDLTAGVTWLDCD